MNALCAYISFMRSILTVYGFTINQCLDEMLFTFATVVFLLTAACSSAGDEGNSTGEFAFKLSTC